MGEAKKGNLTEVALISSIPSSAISDILRGILINLGVRPEEIIESTDRTQVKVATYIRSHKKAIILRNKFRRLHLKNISIRLKILKPKDWRHKWKVDFKPFRLTSRIDVVPMAQKKSFRPIRRLPVYIETANAFGSGLHETTRFMALLLEHCRGQFRNYLDVGTGTGILSLVALKSGAAEILAVDVDRRCTAAAKANLRDNGYIGFSVIRSDIRHYQSRRKFDFVGANLITHELISVRRKLVSLVSSGGYLAVSGIMEENLPALRQAYKSLPLRCLKIIQGKQWVALLFKKKRYKRDDERGIREDGR